MLSKQAYKVKTKPNKENKPPRCSTEYPTPAHKLTRGCLNYEQLKDAYQRTGEVQLRTENNESHHAPAPHPPPATAIKSKPTPMAKGMPVPMPKSIKSTKSKGKSSRSFKKFIEDQENFLNNRQSKIREFKAEASKVEVSECSNLPEIDRVSKRICTLLNYDKEEVVERLCKKKIIQNFKDDEDLFNPKILPRSKELRRGQNVSELLHEDALRRKAKQQVQQAERLLAPVTPSVINANTYQLVCNKMWMEFRELVGEETDSLPLVMAWTVLSEIFGVELNPNKSGWESRICEEISEYLCMGDEETVSTEKLWEFIEIIVKKGEARPRMLREQSSQIIEQFGSLYTCRMAKPKTQREGQQYSFFPETLRSSEGKAQKYRQKLLDQAKEFLQTSHSKLRLGQEVTIEDIFVIDHMMKQASNDKKKMVREQKEMEECTFKPRLSQSYRKPLFMPPKTGPSTRKVSDSKQSLFKSTSSATVSVNQSFMSQSLKPIDLKVQLKKHRRAQRKEKGSNVGEIKNMEKTLMRMAIARKQRELSNQIKSRGYSKGIDNWIEYTQHEKSQIMNQHKKLKGFTYKKVALH